MRVKRLVSLVLTFIIAVSAFTFTSTDFSAANTDNLITNNSFESSSGLC